LIESDWAVITAIHHGGLSDPDNRWNGFYFSGDENDRSVNLPDSLITRNPAALRGEGRTPGIDIISRAGAVTYEPTAGRRVNRTIPYRGPFIAGRVELGEDRDLVAVLVNQPEQLRPGLLLHPPLLAGPRRAEGVAHEVGHSG